MKAILISLALTALLTLSAQAQTPSDYTVTVAIFNDAHVPANVLKGAQQTASFIFAKSGIKVRWIFCGGQYESLGQTRACSQAGHFDLRIVNGCPNFPISVFGISYVSYQGMGTQADVFYTKITAFRADSTVDRTTLLGYAMAHELGHLLLGCNSHSPSGLMRAAWGPEELSLMARGALDLSDDQSQAIKAKLSMPEGDNLAFRDNISGR
jgi:hypothetical protein